MSTGFYDMPRLLEANRALAPLGLRVRVVCVSTESGLSFERWPEDEATADVQLRSYHALGVELKCLDRLRGRPRLVVPRFVRAPSELTDEQLVRPATDIGYLNDDSNPNAACLGTVMVGPHIGGVAMGEHIGNAPGSWWMYADMHNGRPFVLTGVLLAAYECLPRKLIDRQINLIKRKVKDAGLKFNSSKLWVWVSPGGRNDCVSISDEHYKQLLAAGPEYEFYLYEGDGTPGEKPHRLDLTGLFYRLLVTAGIPQDHIGGFHAESITTRTNRGKLKWGRAQELGTNQPSCIIAGVVHASAMPGTVAA